MINIHDRYQTKLLSVHGFTQNGQDGVSYFSTKQNVVLHSLLYTLTTFFLKFNVEEYFQRRLLWEFWK